MTLIHPAADEPVRPRAHAEAAAEAIRALNRATLRHGDPAGYEWPSDVDAVIGQLQVLAAYLPQALQQARSWLLDQQTAGRVGHDTPGRKPEFAVAVAVGRLNEAELHCQDLANALGEARRESSHLTGRERYDVTAPGDEREQARPEQTRPAAIRPGDTGAAGGTGGAVG